MDTDAQPKVPVKQGKYRRIRFLLIAILVTLIAAGAWLVGTQSGARAGLSILSSISANAMRAESIHGRLLGPLQIGKLTIAVPAFEITLDDYRLDWSPAALLKGDLHVLSMHARAIDINIKSHTGEPLQMPQTLALPFRFHMDRISIDGGRVQSDSTELLRLDDSALSLVFDGETYRLKLEKLSLHSAVAGVTASLRGDATLAAAAPFALHADLSSGAEAVFGAKTLAASGRVQVDGTLQEMAAVSDLRMGDASLKGQAVVRPFAAHVLGAASLTGQGIDLSAFRQDLPKTGLKLSLSAPESGDGMLTVTNTDAGRYDERKLPLTSLNVNFRIDERRFSFNRITAQLGAAGDINGKGAYKDEELTLTLNTARLDLHQLDHRLRSTQLEGQGDIRHRAGQQEFTLKLDEPLKKTKLAVTAQASLANDVLQLDHVTLELGGGRMEAYGRVELSGGQQFTVAGKFRNFHPNALGDFRDLPQVYLNGDVSVQGQRSPTIVAAFRFDIRDSAIAGQPLRGEGQGELKEDSLDIAKLSLIAGENKLDMHGRLAREKGNVNFRLYAPKLGLLGPGFGGMVDLSGSASGSFAAPQIKAEWTARQLRVLDKLQLDSSEGKATFQLDRGMPLLVRAASWDARMQGVHSGDWQIRDLSIQGQFSPSPNEPLELAVRGHDIHIGHIGNGRAESIEINAHGTTASHALDATLLVPGQQWRVMANGGLSPLNTAPQWQGMIQRLDGTGRVAAHLAKPARLMLSSGHQQLDAFRMESAIANVEIEQFVRDQGAITTRGRVQAFQVAQALAFTSKEPAFSTDLTLSGEWDLRVTDTLNGSLMLRRDSGDITALGNNPEPLRVRNAQASAVARNGQITAQLHVEGERAGKIDADLRTNVARIGERVVFAEDAPLSGNITALLPSLGWPAKLVSPNLLTEGKMQASVTVGGTLARPDLHGRINGQALRLLVLGSGIDLRDGVLDTEFQGTQLQLTNLRFGAAGNDVTATGRIDFADLRPSAQLKVAANKFPLFDRADRRIVVSGNSDVAWNEKTANITGTFKIDSGFVDIGSAAIPQLSDDVVIVGRNKGEAVQRGLPAHIDVGIALAEEGIALKGRGLNAQLGGDLRLVSEPGEPLRARGTLQLIKGTYSAYGRELAIERGILRFNGPLDNPGLDILAMRRGQQVEAGVTILGTVLSPRVALVSEPSVPDADKLSWLVLGRGLNESGANDASALQSAAGALLAQGAAAGVQSQIARTFGLDELKLGTTDTDPTLQEHVVTLGKRVSSRLYVSFQQGLEQATSVLRLRYTLSRRLTIEAGAGTQSTVLLFYNIAYD